MALTEKYIEKVRVGGNTADYDHIIAAKYISATETNSPDSGYKTWKDITDLVSASTDLIFLTALPAANAENYAKYKNDIVLVPASASATNNACDEYIINRTGTSTFTYSWEKIGTTQADLNNKADHGTYTSTTPSTNQTSSAGAQTASGTATVTYKKSDTATGAAGKHSHTVDSHTHAPTVTAIGTLATTTIGQITAVGSLPTRASVTVATGEAAEDGTFSALKSATASGTATVLTGVKSTGSETFVKSYPGSTKYLKTGNVTGVSGSTTASKATAGTAVTVGKRAASQTTVGNANVGTAVSFNAVSTNTDVTTSFASVSNGVLTFTDKTSSKVTTTSKSIAPAVASETKIYGVDGTATITPYTFADITVPVAASASTFVTGLTTTAAEGMNVLVGLGTASTGTAITGVSSNGTTTAVTGITTTSDTALKTLATVSIYQITGVGSLPTRATLDVVTGASTTVSAAGAASAATLTSSEIAAHTHSIGLTDTSITGTAAVAVSSHTHDLGNHTHSVTI